MFKAKTLRSIDVLITCTSLHTKQMITYSSTAQAVKVLEMDAKQVQIDYFYESGPISLYICYGAVLHMVP